MSEPRENPTAGRRYLKKADYYRLGYQLSAQLMNAEHRRHYQRELFALSGGRHGGTPAFDYIFRPSSSRARSSAERFVEEIDEMLEWYSRRKAKQWAFWRRLRAKEKRLEQFLTRTVRPCLELVGAASLLWDENDAGAEEKVEPLRAAALKGDLSYRALYNLACYEAHRGGRQVGQTLRYLAEALREAPADRVEELARWAEKDPSLSGLRGDERFKELLARFQPQLSQLIADDTLSSHGEKATELIAENPGISASELTRALQVTPTYVHRVLADLEKERRIKKEGRRYFPED